MKTNLLILTIVTAFGLSAVAWTAEATPGQGPSAARFKGGQGSSWQTGRNQRGFMGTYGKCRYSGFAGPNGYKLNKAC